MSADEPAADSATDPAKLVADLSRAHIPARCLHVIAECGVADAVGPDGATPAAIARHTGLTADALDRMLRLLAGYGVFAHGPGGTYRHTPASETLRTDHPKSLRAYVRMAGMPAYWDRFTELPETARTGRPRYDMAGLVDYYAAHPAESAIFNTAMETKARTALLAVAAAYDFGAAATIADVGGGRGHLLRAILERAPNARGILFERPHVVADAEPAANLALAGGDFFTDALPAADLYLLMDVLHDWSDGEAVRILAAVRSAAPACSSSRRSCPRCRARTSARRSTSSCWPSRAAASGRLPSTRRSSRLRASSSRASCPPPRSTRSSRPSPSAADGLLRDLPPVARASTLDAVALVPRVPCVEIER
jgi:C-methyltransferase